jgi:hypothetical protein
MPPGCCPPCVPLWDGSLSEQLSVSFASSISSIVSSIHRAVSLARRRAVRSARRRVRTIGSAVRSGALLAAAGRCWGRVVACRRSWRGRAGAAPVGVSGRRVVRMVAGMVLALPGRSPWRGARLLRRPGAVRPGDVGRCCQGCGDDAPGRSGLRPGLAGMIRKLRIGFIFRRTAISESKGSWRVRKNRIGKVLHHGQEGFIVGSSTRPAGPPPLNRSCPSAIPSEATAFQDLGGFQTLNEV